MPRLSPIGIDGVSVSWQPDDAGRIVKVKVRVRDQAGKYQPKTFDVENWNKDGTPCLPADAKAWAVARRGTYLAGTETAGKADLAEIGKAYVDQLRTTAGESYHADHTEHVVNTLVGLGIRDLKADDFPDRVLSWLGSLKANWWPGAKDAKNRRRNKLTISNTSRNKILRELRAVVSLAIVRRRIAYNPLASLKRFKQVATLKPLFTVEELQKIVHDRGRERMVGDEVREDPWWLAACLLVYTGHRAGDVMRLRWEHFDPVNMNLTINVKKTSEEVMIPLQPELWDLLAPIAKPHGFVIEDEYMRSNGTIERHGKRKKEPQAAYVKPFRRYLKRIGITPGKRGVHSLRHCFITIMLAMDTDPGRVMRMVAHKVYTTTMGYGVQQDKYLKAVAEWPKGQLVLRRTVAEAKAEAAKASAAAQ